jgi:hypothetical protein
MVHNKERCMNMIKHSYFLLAVFLILNVSAGCSSSSGTESSAAQTGTTPPSDTSPQGTGEGISRTAIEKILQDQGFGIEREIATGDDTGFASVNSDGKRLAVLTGSHYNMGRQMSSLYPEGTYRMVKEYPIRLMESFIGMKQKDYPKLFDLIFKAQNILARGAAFKDKAIPQVLLEEMQGVADGATAAGYPITFDDVLALSEGYDALFSIFQSGIISSFAEIASLSKTLGAEDYVTVKDGKVLFPKANPSAIGCNGFVVSGRATEGGRVYHGRDFMFPTGDIFQDEAVTAVYLPDERLPFTAVTAPGIVGLTAGMNSKGISMGVDVVYGCGTRSTPGIGCLLVIRDIMENASGLDEAIERMKEMNRGVSWIYVLAGGEHSSRFTNGVAIEEGMSVGTNGRAFKTGADLLPLIQQIQYASLISRLDSSDMPEAGMMFRTQDWMFPEAFKGMENFYEQIEEWDDVVVATNHYITPNMQFTTLSPWMELIGSPDRKTSQTRERYEDLVSRIGKAYGSIDFAAARDLIDFLNPNRGEWNKYAVNGQIEGHHDIFDNQALVMEALYGYYHPGEPWVRVDLKPFLGINQK